MPAWAELIGALRKGAMLTDAATWKERQVLVNAVVGLLASGYAFARSQGWLTIEVEHAALVDLGTGLGAALFAAYNILATVATSDKVGLPPVAVASGAVGELRVTARPAAAGRVQADAGRGPDRIPNPFLDDN